MAASVGKVSKVVEWLGDTGVSTHVCNDLTLMRDVRTREKPIVLRQLVGDIKVYTTGTVQLDCLDNFGGSTVVSLLDTCYIPEPKSTSSISKSSKNPYTSRSRVSI